MRYTALFARLLTVALLMTVSVNSVIAAPPAPPSGECESPRDSMLQLLYYSQPEHLSVEKAAKCFDFETSDADPQLAITLKRVLDLKKLYVELSGIPANSDYKDPDSGKQEYAYFPRLFPELVAVFSDGQWKIGKSAIRVAPAMYEQLVPYDLDREVTQLPGWMQVEYLGIYPWQLFGCIILALLALILQRIVLWILHRFLVRLRAPWAKNAIDRSSKPLGAIVGAMVFLSLLPLIHFPVQVHITLTVAAELLRALGIIWLGFNSTDVLSEEMARQAERTASQLDDQLVPLVRRFLKLIISAVGVIITLQSLHVDVGSLLAGLGIGGLAFALAAKDTLANLFGSLTIFVDRPFQVGDAIAIGSSIQGVVDEVGFRTTRVRTYDKTMLTVPNALITNSVIENLSMREVRRYRTVLGLTYDTPATKITAFCEGVENIISALPGLEPDNKTVEFTGFGASALEVLVTCYTTTSDYGPAMRTQHNFNLAVLQLAEELNVGFAFPTQTLHVDSIATPSAPATPSASQVTPEEIAASYQEGGERFANLKQRQDLPKD